MKTIKTFETFIKESVDVIYVDTQELIDSLEAYYNNHKQATLVLGKPGSDKDNAVTQFAKLNKLTINVINASHLNIEEFENVKIRKDDVILFKDIDRASEAVKSKIFKFTFENENSFIVLTAVSKNNLESILTNKLATIELK